MQVNWENFEHWMLTQLLLNLEKSSVAVMDNHNVLFDKPPTQNWRKDKITWLFSPLPTHPQGRGETISLIVQGYSK